MKDITNMNDAGRMELHHSNEKYQLILPCEVKDFTEFISNLLGKPQEEKGKIEGDFHVEPKYISNIYHLINQRVTQQNDGSLINFTIAVLYDNGTSILHKNVNDFESYYPTSDTTPIEIVISFTYLIKFSNKSVPEKQEIEVIISTEDDRLHRNGAWISGGLIEYRINHTDRTWASDISNVIKNHASNFVNKTSWFTKMMAQYDDDVFEYSFWLILFSFCSYWYFSTKSLFFSDAEKSININIFYDHILTFSYILCSLVVFIKIISKVAEYKFFIRKSSYITLIDKDYDKMQKRKRKLFVRMTGYITAFILNVTAGFFASYIYAGTIS